MMKKFLCLLLSMLLVCLCGCDLGSGLLSKTEPPSPYPDIYGDITPPPSFPTFAPQFTIPDLFGEAETTPATTEPEFSLGKTENNHYHNDYFGISCTLPSDWIFYTDEEIRELNNFTMDTFDKDFAEALKNATIIYDMFAKDPNNFDSTNVNMEKLTPLQALTLDLKINIETQLSAVETSYTNMGYTNIQTAYKKITVNGKEYDGMTITCQLQGIDFYAVSICYIKNSYLVNINVGSLVTDKTDTLLSYYTIS